MIGRMPSMGGSVRVEEPTPMRTVRLTVEELRLLARAVDGQAIAAERDGDLAAADRAAGRASDLRLKALRPSPAFASMQTVTGHSRLVAATWAGVPA